MCVYAVCMHVCVFVYMCVSILFCFVFSPPLISLLLYVFPSVFLAFHFILCRLYFRTCRTIFTPHTGEASGLGEGNDFLHIPRVNLIFRPG